MKTHASLSALCLPLCLLSLVLTLSLSGVAQDGAETTGNTAPASVTVHSKFGDKSSVSTSIRTAPRACWLGRRRPAESLAAVETFDQNTGKILNVCQDQHQRRFHHARSCRQRGGISGARA